MACCLVQLGQAQAGGQSCTQGIGGLTATRHSKQKAFGEGFFIDSLDVLIWFHQSPLNGRSVRRKSEERLARLLLSAMHLVILQGSLPSSVWAAAGDGALSSKDRVFSGDFKRMLLPSSES